jgi:hypothetical protein
MIPIVLNALPVPVLDGNSTKPAGCRRDAGRALADPAGPAGPAELPVIL